MSRPWMLAILLAFVTAVHADSDAPWPRWRGPRDGGSVDGGAYPASWKDPKDIAWKVKLPGIGCSTPIVVDGRIVLTAPVEGQNAVLALDLGGAMRWQTKIARHRPGKHRNGSGSNPSPVTDGKRVFAYFKSGDLAGIDLDGKLLWKTNLQERFAKDTLYWDVGTSPVLTAKDVVVAVMHSGESYLAAFNQETGELAWKVSRNYRTPAECDHSYATPIVLEQDGRQTILVWGAEHVTAHAAEDGRVLWQCGDFNPDQTPNWPAVSSAVLAGDVMVVPHMRGGALTAVRLGGKGDVTATHKAWTRKDAGSFVPTPAFFAGKVFVLGDEGQLECLDAKTGRTLWSERLPKHRAKYYASPLVANGKLYAIREDGVAFVVNVDRGFELLSENPMGERVIASPVPLAGGKLLVRGEQHLFCIGK